MDNYLIIRSGHRFRLGSGLTVEQEAGMMQALLGFLQRHGLLSRDIETPVASWDDFELRADDFTPLGLACMRLGIRPWLGGIDRGKASDDVSILEKYLKKAKQNAASA